MQIGYGYIKFFSKENVEERKFLFWTKRIYHVKTPYKIEVVKYKENDKLLYFVKCTNLIEDTFSKLKILEREEFQEMIDELISKYNVYDNELHMLSNEITSQGASL